MADMSKFSPDKGLTIVNVNDSTSRQSIAEIQELIPSGATTSNKLATLTDVSSAAGEITDAQWVAITALLG